MITHSSLARRTVAGALALSLLAPSLVLAQAGSAAGSAGSAAGATNVTSTAAPAGALSAAVMTRAKEKANKEIDRRINALNELVARIGGMSKISPEFKQNLTTNVQNQINLLTALKTKIEGDTDGATLKADIKSITQTHRVFVLLMPQARIAAAADREATLINMFIGLGTKLQARLNDAQQKGADITALAAALTDMEAKLKSAQTHAQAAVIGSATLAPDEGDAAKMKANTDALKAARAEIVAAQKDLNDARKDAETIIKGLRTLKINTPAPASPAATP